MFRIIIRIVQLQFFLLCIFIACCLVAGEQKAPFWFVLVSLTLLALTVTGMISQRRR